jgi:hypothetical protein
MFGCVAGTTTMLLGICSAAGRGPPPESGDVPFVKQEKDGWAASIAMVMQYWQRQQGEPSQDSDATHIQRLSYSAKAHGIYASDMESYLKEKGFHTFTIRGEWEDLKLRGQRTSADCSAQASGWRRALALRVVTGLDQNGN